MGCFVSRPDAPAGWSTFVEVQAGFVAAASKIDLSDPTVRQGRDSILRAFRTANLVVLGAADTRTWRSEIQAVLRREPTLVDVTSDPPRAPHPTVWIGFDAPMVGSRALLRRNDLNVRSVQLMGYLISSNIDGHVWQIHACQLVNGVQCHFDDVFLRPHLVEAASKEGVEARPGWSNGDEAHFIRAVMAAINDCSVTLVRNRVDWGIVRSMRDAVHGRPVHVPREFSAVRLRPRFRFAAAEKRGLRIHRAVAFSQDVRGHYRTLIETGFDEKRERLLVKRGYEIQPDRKAVLRVWVKSHRRNADAPLHRPIVYSMEAP